jgi:hypothetical protein
LGQAPSQQCRAVSHCNHVVNRARAYLSSTALISIRGCLPSDGTVRAVPSPPVLWSPRSLQQVPPLDEAWRVCVQLHAETFAIFAPDREVSMMACFHPLAFLSIWRSYISLVGAVPPAAPLAATLTLVQPPRAPPVPPPLRALILVRTTLRQAGLEMCTAHGLSFGAVRRGPRSPVGALSALCYAVATSGKQKAPWRGSLLSWKAGGALCSSCHRSH